MAVYSLLSFSLTLALTITFTALFLPLLRRKHIGQRILSIGPSWHKSKEGTPTMGGISFLLAISLVGILVTVIALPRYGESVRKPILVLLYAILNGTVGMVDDTAKLKKKQNEGLLPWQKLLLQSVFAAGFLAMLHLYGDGTSLRIPYTGMYLELGPFYYLFSLLFLLGSVNFVNLTDGIDGLASTVTLITGAFFTLAGIFTSDLSLLILAACLCGGSLGFLFFNAHPAKLFMGDTGSLFFGGLIVGCAYLCGSPAILLPAGIVFYVEGLSVILQVAVYKLTRKRLFKMAPLHHHFEKKGFGEWKILRAFSFLSVIGAAIALPGVI